MGSRCAEQVEILATLCIVVYSKLIGLKDDALLQITARFELADEHCSFLSETLRVDLFQDILTPCDALFDALAGC